MMTQTATKATDDWGKGGMRKRKWMTRDQWPTFCPPQKRYLNAKSENAKHRKQYAMSKANTPFSQPRLA